MGVAEEVPRRIRLTRDREVGWSGGFGMARILASFLRTTRVQSCGSYPSRMVLRLFGFVVSAGADIDCFIQFLPRSFDGLLCLAP